jgi:hypothetical protein
MNIGSFVFADSFKTWMNNRVITMLTTAQNQVDRLVTQLRDDMAALANPPPTNPRDIQNYEQYLKAFQGLVSHYNLENGNSACRRSIALSWTGADVTTDPDPGCCGGCCIILKKRDGSPILKRQSSCTSSPGGTPGPTQTPGGGGSATPGGGGSATVGGGGSATIGGGGSTRAPTATASPAPSKKYEISIYWDEDLTPDVGLTAQWDVWSVEKGIDVGFCSVSGPTPVLVDTNAPIDDNGSNPNPPYPTSLGPFNIQGHKSCKYTGTTSGPGQVKCSDGKTISCVRDLNPCFNCGGNPIGCPMLYCDFT